MRSGCTGALCIRFIPYILQGWIFIMSIPERFYCFQNHIFRVKSTKMVFFEYDFFVKVRSGCTGALFIHFIPYVLMYGHL